MNSCTQPRTLSDADIKAIVEAIHPPHACVFTDDDRHDIAALLRIYRDSTAAM